MSPKSIISNFFLLLFLFITACSSPQEPKHANDTGKVAQHLEFTSIETGLEKTFKKNLTQGTRTKPWCGTLDGCPFCCTESGSACCATCSASGPMYCCTDDGCGWYKVDDGSNQDVNPARKLVSEQFRRKR
mgnify:CR=1 FL=1